MLSESLIFKGVTNRNKGLDGNAFRGNKKESSREQIERLRGEGVGVLAWDSAVLTGGM